MFEQGFEAVLQRRGRRRTARAGALHLEIDIALVEAAIEDVAAVARDSGADARFDQFPDLRDDVGVGGIVGEPLILRRHREARGARRMEQRHVGQEMRSEEHTSELQSLMRISYAVFCLKKKKSQVSAIAKIPMIIC